MDLSTEIRIATANDSCFEEQVKTILKTVADWRQTILRLVFFADITDNADFSRKQSLVFEAVQRTFGYKKPLVTLIAQKPLEWELAAEVQTTKSDVQHLEWENTPYLLIQGNGVKALFTTATPDAKHAEDSISTQSTYAFERLKAILDHEEMPIQSIARQWNYIPNITGTDSGGQRYQQFNDARSHFYNLTEWDNGYPAATGIGTATGSISIDLNAYCGITAIPIDNPLQTAAHHYSKKVLEITAENKGTPPKFERAKMLSCQQQKILFVSGTAAIRGEQTVRRNAAEQTDITIENICVLMHEASAHELTYMRVYVKQPKDFTAIKSTLDNQLPTVEKLLVQADICRPDLLVEIEGMGK